MSGRNADDQTHEKAFLASGGPHHPRAELEIESRSNNDLKLCRLRRTKRIAGNYID
jgi:hypothetical protein